MRASRRIFICLLSGWCTTIMSSPRKQFRKQAENIHWNPKMVSRVGEIVQNEVKSRQKVKYFVKYFDI